MKRLRFGKEENGVTIFPSLKILIYRDFRNKRLQSIYILFTWLNMKCSFKIYENPELLPFPEFRRMKIKAKNVKLENTISLMDSEKYEERFQAEYFQTKIRYEELTTTLLKHKEGVLCFKNSCIAGILDKQRLQMKKYLLVLKERAATEGIDLQSIEVWNVTRYRRV